MATRPKQSDGIGKVKFRVIEFELEGTDATLQDTIRGFTAALNRASGAAPARLLGNGQTKQLENGPSHEEEAEDTIPRAADDAEVVEAAPQRPPQPRAKPKVVNYEILKDVVFDDVSPTLKEFAAIKAPPSDLSKYLVIAYWFKHHKKQPDVKPDHFYTAYRLLGWKVPRNPAAPVRELRSSRDNRLSKGTEQGFSTINQVGENTVDELGKSA